MRETCGPNKNLPSVKQSGKRLMNELEVICERLAYKQTLYVVWSWWTQRFKHPAYFVIISTYFNNSFGIHIMEYSCETPKFSTLMSHSSNRCLLDDLGRSMNWNEIHIISPFFLHDWLTLPALDLAWKQNPPIWLQRALAKYWRGFQICSEPGLLFCWWCAQIPVCSQEAGNNQSEVPICHSYT